VTAILVRKGNCRLACNRAFQ